MGNRHTNNNPRQEVFEAIKVFNLNIQLTSQWIVVCVYFDEIARKLFLEELKTFIPSKASILFHLFPLQLNQ